MRKGYRSEVKAEAITRRYQGMTWPEVQAAIQKRFGVRVSVRQMQTWYQNYRDSDHPEGMEYIARAIEMAANEAKPLAQAKMIGEVFPLWMHLLGEPYNLAPEEAAWVSTLVVFESQIGRDRLDQVWQQYVRYRDMIQQSGIKVKG